MALHVSNVILSLIMSMFVDEEGVYIISINAMKEMEKRGGNLVFLTEKGLSFHTKAWLQFLPSYLISRVCSTLI